MFVLAYQCGDDNYVNEKAFNKYFFQKSKLKNITVKFMVEIFMIKQLMIQLSNTTKSEKYQQDKVMITQLVVYKILLILKIITD